MKRTIIAALHAHGEQRFGEIGNLIGIADRMLSERLKELEARGLLERIVDGGPPVRVSSVDRDWQGLWRSTEGAFEMRRELIE